MLTQKTHAILDYALVVWGIASLWVLGLQPGSVEFYYTLGISLAGLLIVVTTNYPGGLLRLMPFRMHWYLDLSSAGVFIGLPWYLFPKTPAAWSLTALGVANATYAAMTRVRDVEE